MRKKQTVWLLFMEGPQLPPSPSKPSSSSSNVALKLIFV